MVVLNGGVVACQITNTAVAPTLTLVKEVVNDNGGTEPASAWTLTGTGPTTISGPTGDPLVTDAVVRGRHLRADRVDDPGLRGVGLGL